MFNFQCAFYFAWAYIQDGFGHLVYQLCKLFPFAGADPFQFQPFRLNPHLGDVFFHQLEPAQAFVITGLVMAVAGMATANEHPVGALLESGQDEGRVDPSRAHDADDADVRGIAHPGGTRKVGAGVRAPVAKKRNDSWSEVHGQISLYDIDIIPSISERIWRSVKCLLVMAPEGHADPQVPQPLHSTSFTSDDFLSSLYEIAP